MSHRLADIHLEVVTAVQQQYDVTPRKYTLYGNVASHRPSHLGAPKHTLAHPSLLSFLLSQTTLKRDFDANQSKSDFEMEATEKRIF